MAGSIQSVDVYHRNNRFYRLMQCEISKSRIGVRRTTMIIDRCPSPVRDLLASSKHPPRRMSIATPPLLGSRTVGKRAGDASKRIEGDLPKALLEHLRDLMRTAPLLNVLSIVNAAPGTGQGAPTCHVGS